ncbi:MAG: UvrD-helicase domain-containing protein [Holosporaceae bacterium]|jgi:ATP-dependent helicase/nuclease subunit A|nr:UvrD-helicase domain-containing protein [Holosporaceae bacterium]
MLSNTPIFSSFWISASAGTGKTKSLIDRILLLLLNGVAPEKILCLTYTNAAASEMLERLSDKLQKFSEMSDNELKANLQLLGMNGNESSIKFAKSLYEKSCGMSWVSIQTIHSFCFQLLQRFPLETGLLPGIKLCDNYQLKHMMNESIHSVFSGNSSDLSLIAEHELNLFDLIEGSAIKIYRFIDKLGDLQKTYCTFFDVDPKFLDMSNKEIDEFLFQRFFQNNHRKVFADLADGLALGSKTDIKHAEIFRKSAQNPSSNFLDAFLTEKKLPLKSLCTQKITDTHVVELLQNTALKALNFWETKKQIISAKTNIAFWRIITKVMESFQKIKVSRHCLDFDDIILRSIDLLQNIDWVMFKIDSSLDHILVDEAQDTSSEQWEIIKLITEEFFSNYQSNKTVFVVGDEKQSIYSFQGADVKLFREMRDYFAENTKKSGQNFYEKPLNKSYRSTGNILAFVDKVLAAKIPGISHSTHRNPQNGIVEVIDLFDDDETESAKKKISQYIADFIKKTLEDGVWVESRQRPAKAEDFLILFQRRDIETMKCIASTLKKSGISVGGLDRIQLNDELIVEDLIALAEFATFPLDDLMCARVLKSPIVGITENDLMQACINRKDEYLWDYMRKNYDVKNLESYVDKALQLSAYNFFMHVLTNGAREKFISRLGDECIDILQEFLNLVMNYERENTASLASFLQWFRKFASEHEVKRESFSGKNIVRLMTVHASKGLQSPFVILADAHFVKNKRKKILQSRDGLLLWDFSIEYRVKKMEELCAEQQAADDAELYRLFYVAMTRAEDFLYILGEKSKRKIPEKCWYSLLQCD